MYTTIAASNAGSQAIQLLALRKNLGLLLVGHDGPTRYNTGIGTYQSNLHHADGLLPARSNTSLLRSPLLHCTGVGPHCFPHFYCCSRAPHKFPVNVQSGNASRASSMVRRLRGAPSRPTSPSVPIQKLITAVNLVNTEHRGSTGDI